MSEKNSASIDKEVLIVGGGPAGLMMACQLALHNISFRVIDKKEHVNNFSGALLIQARTLEIFDQMGIAGKILKVVCDPSSSRVDFHRKDRHGKRKSLFGRQGSPSPLPAPPVARQRRSASDVVVFPS